MHEKAAEFYRKEMLEGLLKLPDDWQMMFKRMYANGDLSKNISDVVNMVPHEKMDWALSQVTRSLDLINTRRTNDKTPSMRGSRWQTGRQNAKSR